MKLTIKAIQSLSRPIRMDLALALNFSEAWINKLIEHNKDNGPLTTAKSLQVIQDKTGLPDTEILEDAEQTVA